LGTVCIAGPRQGDPPEQGKVSSIYKAAGDLRPVPILLGHTKVENTVQYLGVGVEDALTLAEGIEI